MKGSFTFQQCLSAFSKAWICSVTRWSLKAAPNTNMIGLKGRCELNLSALPTALQWDYTLQHASGIQVSQQMLPARCFLQFLNQPWFFKGWIPISQIIIWLKPSNQPLISTNWSPVLMITLKMFSNYWYEDCCGEEYSTQFHKKKKGRQHLFKELFSPMEAPPLLFYLIFLCLPWIFRSLRINDWPRKLHPLHPHTIRQICQLCTCPVITIKTNGKRPVPPEPGQKSTHLVSNTLSRASLSKPQK